MYTDYFYPELGGIQDSVAIIAQALGQRGHAVDICAPRYGRRDYQRVAAAAGERDLGANVRVRRRRSLPFPSSTQQSRAAVTAPLAWLTAGRPDVIHVHSFFGLGLEALLGAACRRIPLVGTNHTSVAGFAPHIPVTPALAAAYVRWFYNRCDAVTAPSRSVFADLGPDMLRPPCRVLSNPIDTRLFAPAPASARAASRARFGLTRHTVTYAGRLGPEKHVDVLLRAAAASTAAPDLAIAGHGSHAAALRRLAAGLGLTGRVHFLGTLAPPDLAALLQASDLFAIMSTSETQSMVALQAMACGLPVVAAAARALPDVVGAESGVLVAPHDHAALAAALDELLAAPARRRLLGEGGRRAAEACGVAAVTDAWEALYRALLDERCSA